MKNTIETILKMTIGEALIIVKKFLDQRRLNKIQETVFCQSWEGQSYLEIASNFGYDHGYIKDAGSKLWQLLSEAVGEKVTKNNFKLVLQQHWYSLRDQESLQSPGVPPQLIAGLDVSTPCLRQDWDEAIDVSVFFDRTVELTKLEDWIVKDCCRLVVVLGMGGIGKTALCAKLAGKIQSKFDYLIWRSLRNAPPVKELLEDLIKFLSNQQHPHLATTPDGRMSLLMTHLQKHRCLLILDNAESVLQDGDRTGQYRDGYEGYGQMLRCVAETLHQSTVVLTSREKPRGLAIEEGETLPVRSLHLTGLPPEEGRKIFQARGSFYGTESEWKVLIEHYAGNPLALKMVAPAIRDFFDGHISRFLEILKQGRFVFDDIRNLLDQQFNRLSDVEKAVMFWLAINREPVSFPELQKYLVTKISSSELLETLASLQRRSLIDKKTNGFTQQPVVMEYMSEKLDLLQKFVRKTQFAVAKPCH